MEILYVTSSLPYGPGEAFVIAEVAALRRRGHAIAIVPVHGRGEVVHEDAAALLPSTLTRALVSAEIVAVAIRRAVRSPARALRAALLLRRSRSLRILLKNLAVLPKALWLADVAERRRFEHIHAHWAATSSTLALLVSDLSGIPWSLTTHRWDIGENNLLRSKAKRATFVRAINRIGLEKIVSLTGPETPRPLVLHMGVELPPADAPHPPPQAGRRVVFPASLREVKGHRYVLGAVAILKGRGCEIQLDCVGDGPLRKELERLASASDLEAEVTFVGTLSHRELLGGLASGTWTAAVLGSVVTPAGEHEGIPVSLLEAMSVGVPAIATATGGIPDLLGEGAGLLVPERDPAALADAIERVLEEADLRARLVASGSRRVRERFDVDVIAARLEELFAASARPRELVDV